MRVLAFLLVGALACGDDSSPENDAGANPDAPGVDVGMADATQDVGDEDAGEDAGEADSGPGPQPDPVIPEPTGACPTFSPSASMIAVQPAGLPIRRARLWISEAAETLDGPMVFYWHGTGSNPGEAQFGLGDDNIQWILDQGGIVVAPESDPTSGTYPWFAVLDVAEDRDFRVADELLGCAAEQVGVDPQRIHSIGFSAGGLQTSQMSFRRASYIASVVTYSGGLILARRPITDEPNNRFSALLFHGGPNDIVVVRFQDTSERYWNLLDSGGHFAAICNHGGRHTIPFDAAPSVRDFFEAHPWGVTSPYEDGLPDGFYAPCQLSP